MSLPKVQMYVEHAQCARALVGHWRCSPTWVPVSLASCRACRYEKAHRVAKAHLSPAERTELYIALAQARGQAEIAFVVLAPKSARAWSSR